MVDIHNIPEKKGFFAIAESVQIFVKIWLVSCLGCGCIFLLFLSFAGMAAMQSILLCCAVL